MSVWDELNHAAEDLLRGDWQGALGDVGLAPAKEGQPAPVSGMQIGGISVGGRPGSLGKPKPSGESMEKGAESGQKCCNRFSFSNGFLVDGVVGRVWQFNTATNSLDEIPFTNNNAKQKLFESLIESKLSAIRARYELEELTTVPRPRRASLLAQFEKDHLDPIRAAAQAGAY
jgi:hypothetical protein